MGAIRAVLLQALVPALPCSAARPEFPPPPSSEFLLQAVAVDEDLSLSFLQTRTGFFDVQVNFSRPADLHAARSQTQGLFNAGRPGSAIRYRQRLYNTEDVQYVADVTIGNQNISGVLDTGSFELVVFSDECTTCGDRTKLYSPEHSTTHADGRLLATHSYGSGDVVSQESFDRVQIGPLRAERQKFWEATRADMPILSISVFQAIVGVGPPNVPADEAWGVVEEELADIQKLQRAHVPVPSAVADDARSSVDVAKVTSESTTMLDSFGVRLFSVCLGALPLSDGHFIWNDHDPRGSPALFTRLPVSGRSTWGVQMFEAGLQLGHKGGRRRVDLGCGAGCGAIVDSGTSLLVAPTAVIQQMQDALEGLHADCSNMNDMPILTFSVGGHTLSLPPDAYIGRVVGEVARGPAGFLSLPALPPGREHSSCRLLMMEQDSDTQFGPMWILGMPFFRKYYTTFDVGGSDGLQRSIFVSLADPQKIGRAHV